ncbi:hypothetical protein [Roseovarius ramblicola]|uniref:Type IV pilus biogenesis n=1 Tax=Roseovarius ramblicola TaxID=2022336 RepID=A0ABV5I4F7_9RHOB
MKPNFALDLTFDGITLLHRAGEAGWHVVGEVALDSPTLDGDLAALRRKANTLDPSGMRTKLVIPDDQIRYLDIPAAPAPHGDHDAAAADALDGATPYALDELAYDWTVRDARLYVAAVARETLDEAESFAREHKFNPVCFVADPDQKIYAGTPVFGVTGNAGERSDTVERETGPMRRLGALPEAGVEEDKPVSDDGGDGDDDGDDGDTTAGAALPFVSVRAERGLPPAPMPRLEGVARITPGPLPDAEARAISGAALASLAPRDDAPAVGPVADRTVPPKAPTSTKSKARPKTPKASRTAPNAPRVPQDKPASMTDNAAPGAGGAQEAAAVATPSPTETGAVALTPADEAERLTIFGARSSADARRGKPRFLGLILTAVLLLVMIGVAAWAAIFPDSGLGRILRGAEPQIALTPDIPELAAPEPQQEPDAAGSATSEPEESATGTPEPAAPPDEQEIAALPVPAAPPAAQDATGAVEKEPETPDTTERWTAPETPEEARRRYAATGIWPSAPEAPDEPRSGSLDTFYQTSIDAQVTLRDAVALPRAASLAPDPAPPRPALPPPPGRTFELDTRGFVRATPEGALTPEGIRVHSGPPPVRPPETPPRAVPLPGLTPTEEAVEARENLSGIRPRLRPETLIEEHERGALGGRTRTELATLRPRPRPEAIAARGAARAEAAAIAEATDEAVAESLKPRLRPEAIARADRPRAAATAAAPAIPTTASVAQRATARNAINLRQVNLIGVYGTPSNRRALVRLANGQYRKVEVGDRIDGGHVSAIGDTELRYTKSGRNVVLRLPRG